MSVLVADSLSPMSLLALDARRHWGQRGCEREGELEGCVWCCGVVVLLGGAWQIMLGTLIAQDCALGLLLAIMPALAARTSSALSIAWALLKELVLLLLFCSLAWVLARVLVPRFLRMLVRLSRFSMELYQLGIVGNCLCVALLSEYLGLSLEVGAFVAGLMLSGGPQLRKPLATTLPFPMPCHLPWPCHRICTPPDGLSASA